MTDFEDQLRRALERKEPSANFAARVVTQATAAEKRSWPTDWRSWPAAAVATSVLLGGLGVELERRERVRHEGEGARAQLVQAMQITSTKLNQIQRKVQGALR